MRLGLVLGAALLSLVAIRAASASSQPLRRLTTPPPVAAVPPVAPVGQVVPVELVPLDTPAPPAPVERRHVHATQATTSTSALAWRVGRVYGPVLIGLALVLAMVHRMRQR